MAGRRRTTGRGGLGGTGGYTASASSVNLQVTLPGLTILQLEHVRNTVRVVCVCVCMCVCVCVICE